MDRGSNPQSELSAHAVTVSELNGKKIARTTECVGHDLQGVGIIDRPDSARWSHFPLRFRARATEQGFSCASNNALVRDEDVVPKKGPR
jgi:hypothetical protein